MLDAGYYRRYLTTLLAFSTVEQKKLTFCSAAVAASQRGN